MTLAAAHSQTGTTVGIVIFAVFAVAVYWVPTIVAAVRHVPGQSQVLVVNLFLGWTLIGWVVALVMALRPVPQ